MTASICTAEKPEALRASPGVVKERPILFSGPMVRAIIAGQKTVTRRVVRLPRWAVAGTEVVEGGAMEVDTANGCTADVACPYGTPGDLLWVRETWAPGGAEVPGAGKVNPQNPAQAAFYQADSKTLPESWSAWSPSIHMPRWASRLTLRVTDVRVERLCSIDDSDAIREGIPAAGDVRPFARFAALWDSINGKRAPWDSDPWVWRVAFKVAS